jgi:hypothetical protein
VALGSSRGPETQPLARILRTHTSHNTHTRVPGMGVWAHGHVTLRHARRVCHGRWAAVALIISQATDASGYAVPRPLPGLRGLRACGLSATLMHCHAWPSQRLC